MQYYEWGTLVTVSQFPTECSNHKNCFSFSVQGLCIPDLKLPNTLHVGEEQLPIQALFSAVNSMLSFRENNVVDYYLMKVDMVRESFCALYEYNPQQLRGKVRQSSCQH